MDLEATQAIPLSDYEEDTDDEQSTTDRIPVAHLKLTCQKGLNETLFPIYEGENVVGRQQDNCNVYIPLKALSKQHACIEVKGDTHLVYDKSSRNKSRRGKLFLTPDVRYELQNGDRLTFGDVTCVYQKIQTQHKVLGGDNAGSDTGSETGSESMIKSQDEGNKSDQQVAPPQDLSDESEPSSDLLQPTQAFAEDGSGPVRRSLLGGEATLMFAEASDEEEDSPTPAKLFSNNTVVAETPAVAGGKKSKHMATASIPDSASEDEMDEEEKRRIADMATQAYALQSSDEEDEKEMKDSGGFDAETQAYPAFDEADGPTQAYTMVPEETPQRSAVAARRNVPQADIATLAYDMDVEMAHTAKNIMSARKKKSARVSDGIDTIPESQTDTHAFVPASEKISLGGGPTMAFEDIDEEGKTLAATDGDETDDEGLIEDNAPTQTIPDDDMPTQVIPDDDASTQVFTESQATVIATPSPKSKKGQGHHPRRSSGVGSDTCIMETQEFGEEEAATQVLGADESATQVLGIDTPEAPEKDTRKRGISTSSRSADSTQLLDATQVFDDTQTPTLELSVTPDIRTRSKGGKPIMNIQATQVLGATEDTVPKLTLDHTPGTADERSKRIRSEEATQIFDEPTMYVDAEEATQVLGGVDIDEATQVLGGVDMEADTQVLGGVDIDEATQVLGGVDMEADTQVLGGVDMDEATQVLSGTDDEGFMIPTLPARKINSKPSPNNLGEADTQVFSVEDPNLQATQAYGHDDPTMDYTSVTDEEDDAKEKEMFDAPTMAVPLVEDEEDDEEEDETKKKDMFDAPTMAVPLVEDEEDDEEEDETNKKDMFDAPTMAVPLVEDEEDDEEEDETKKKDMFDAPTMAVPLVEDEEDDEEEDETKKKDMFDAPTMAVPLVEDEEDDEEEDETKKKDMFDAPTMAVPLVEDEEDDEEEDETKKKDMFDAPTMAVPLVEDEEDDEEEDETKKKDMFDAPTMAVPLVEDEEDDEEEDETKKKDMFDAPTMAVPLVDDEEEERKALYDEPTIAVSILDEEDDTQEMDPNLQATQPYGDDDETLDISADIPQQNDDNKASVKVIQSKTIKKKLLTLSDEQETQPFEIDEENLPDLRDASAPIPGSSKTPEKTGLNDEIEKKEISPASAMKKKGGKGKTAHVRFTKSVVEKSENDDKDLEKATVNKSKKTTLLKSNKIEEVLPSGRGARGRRKAELQKETKSAEQQNEQPVQNEGGRKGRGKKTSTKEGQVSEKAATTKEGKQTRGRKPKEIEDKSDEFDDKIEEDKNVGNRESTSKEPTEEEDNEKPKPTRKGSRKTTKDQKESSIVSSKLGKRGSGKKSVPESNPQVNTDAEATQGYEENMDLHQTGNEEATQAYGEDESMEASATTTQTLLEGNQGTQLFDRKEETEKGLNPSLTKSGVKGKISAQKATKSRQSRTSQASESGEAENEATFKAVSNMTKPQAAPSRGKTRKRKLENTDESAEVANPKAAKVTDSTITETLHSGRRSSRGKQTKVEDMEVDQSIVEEPKSRSRRGTVLQINQTQPEPEISEPEVQVGSKGKKVKHQALKEVKSEPSAQEEHKESTKISPRGHSSRESLNDPSKTISDKQTVSKYKGRKKKAAETATESSAESADLGTRRSRGRGAKETDKPVVRDSSSESADLGTRRSRGRGAKETDKPVVRDSSSESADLGTRRSRGRGAKETDKPVVRDSSSESEDLGASRSRGRGGKETNKPIVGNSSAESADLGTRRSRGGGKDSDKPVRDSSAESADLGTRRSRGGGKDTDKPVRDSSTESADLGTRRSRGRGGKDSDKPVRDSSSESADLGTRRSRGGGKDTDKPVRDSSAESADLGTRRSRGRGAKETDKLVVRDSSTKSDLDTRRTRGRGGKESEETMVGDSSAESAGTRYSRGRGVEKASGTEARDSSVGSASTDTRLSKGSVSKKADELVSRNGSVKTSKSDSSQDQSQEITQEHEQNTLPAKRARSNQKQTAVTIVETTEEQPSTSRSRRSGKTSGKSTSAVTQKPPLPTRDTAHIKTEADTEEPPSTRGSSRHKVGALGLEGDTAVEEVKSKKGKPKKSSASTSKVPETEPAESAAAVGRGKNRRLLGTVVVKQEAPEAAEDDNMSEASATSASQPTRSRRKRASTPTNSLPSSQESGASSQKRRRTIAGTPTRVKHETEEEVATPSRRRTIDRKPKVMFTGVVDEKAQKIVKDLGGVLVESIYDATHLITDQVRRTVKFLCGVARGIQIVSSSWLDRCKDASIFIDSSPFIIQDNANEKKFGFNLSRSIEQAAQNKMLEGYKIHATKNVKPDPSQMKDIIKCAGGQILNTMPKKFTEQTVVVSCVEDEGVCQAAVEAGIPIVNTEFLLTGILKQQANINMYRLGEQESRGTKRGSSLSKKPWKP